MLSAMVPSLRLGRRAASLAFGAALVACGGSSASTMNATAPSSTAASSAHPLPPEPSTPTGEHAVRRSQVRAVVAGGLGLFLQHVVLDDHPVTKDGHFHGFRIVALPDARFWRGVDIAPGDVIVQINGKPIEHPEEALEVFRSLDSAGEIRVDYEREGRPRQLKYVIVDDVPPAPAGGGRADASAP
jgi:S1-C subfamily serine protease